MSGVSRKTAAKMGEMQWKDGRDQACVSVRQEDTDAQKKRIEELEAEVKRLKNMSTVEMMCENQNIKHHVQDWETRCLKAESEVERLRKVLEHINCCLDPHMSPIEIVRVWTYCAKNCC